MIKAGAVAATEELVRIKEKDRGKNWAKAQGDLQADSQSAVQPPSRQPGEDFSFKTQSIHPRVTAFLSCSFFFCLTLTEPSRLCVS